MIYLQNRNRGIAQLRGSNSQPGWDTIWEISFYIKSYSIGHRQPPIGPLNMVSASPQLVPMLCLSNNHAASHSSLFLLLYNTLLQYWASGKFLGLIFYFYLIWNIHISEHFSNFTNIRFSCTWLWLPSLLFYIYLIFRCSSKPCALQES